ncbi:MAG: dual specificity protein phosphatase family protein [Dissulfurispiraceae bacterium]
MRISGRNKLLSVIVIPLFVVAIYALYIVEKDNFHTITEAEAYRSAQMDGYELKNCINKYHIKSILNLRGKNSNEKWYIDEMKVSSEYNVKHYDVSLSASQEPTPKETQIILQLFKSAPRPILMHCQAGADRSGLVAAMWKVIVDNKSKIEASKELSILYGHLSLGPASAMDRFFEEWRPELTVVKQ